MSITQRLNQVLASARPIEFQDETKFVIFSDCHRGDNSWSDDFAQNQVVFFYALQYYFDKGFTYIEAGDGDELWENSKFESVYEAHKHIFWLLRDFHQEQRLHMLWGNHDMERSDKSIVKQTLGAEYSSKRMKKSETLLKNVQVVESISLNHKPSGGKLLIIHGHQADPFNDKRWRVGRFFVRHWWRHLQLLGIKDPTSPAQNYKKKGHLIDDRLADWANNKHQILIAGHTHRSRLPERGAAPYFNTGSCVHPRCITGLEIADGQINLIKWSMWPDEQGKVAITREELESRELQEVFNDVQHAP